MSPFTDGRVHVAQALDTLGVTVHRAPPENIAPPAAWIIAAPDWINPATLTRWAVTLEVHLAVPIKGTNEDSTDELEQLAWDAAAALAAEGVRVERIAAPDVVTEPSRFAHAALTVTVHVTE